MSGMFTGDPSHILVTIKTIILLEIMTKTNNEMSNPNSSYRIMWFKNLLYKLAEMKN